MLYQIHNIYTIEEAFIKIKEYLGRSLDRGERNDLYYHKIKIVDRINSNIVYIRYDSINHVLSINAIMCSFWSYRG